MNTRIEKMWFILIDGKEEGPFSLLDLRSHKRLTPDTLVRKAGEKKWVPCRVIPELKEVFEDAEEDLPLPEQKPSSTRTLDNGTLVANYDPPSFLFWLLIALIIFIYAVHQLGQK